MVNGIVFERFHNKIILFLTLAKGDAETAGTMDPLHLFENLKRYHGDGKKALADFNTILENLSQWDVYFVTSMSLMTSVCKLKERGTSILPVKA